MYKKDELFKSKAHSLKTFNFGKDVAEVFDDMLERSIPLYSEFLNMIAEIGNKFAVDDTNIYDLGCSTGNTLIKLFENIDSRVSFIGVDFSEHMLSKCKKKAL